MCREPISGPLYIKSANWDLFAGNGNLSIICILLCTKKICFDRSPSSKWIQHVFLISLNSSICIISIHNRTIDLLSYRSFWLGSYRPIWKMKSDQQKCMNWKETLEILHCCKPTDGVALSGHLQAPCWPSAGLVSQIARFVGPTWGPSGADRTQVGPMLAPWTLLSGVHTKIGWTEEER